MISKQNQQELIAYYAHLRNIVNSVHSYFTKFMCISKLIDAIFNCFIYILITQYLHVQTNNMWMIY
jgi:hypothetical protein